MRCTWCGAAVEPPGEEPWVEDSILLPTCCFSEACFAASNEAGKPLFAWVRALQHRAGRVIQTIGGPPTEVGQMTREVETRDAREMRGEPPDLSGWLLF